MRRRSFATKKLLVASLGVASATYAACSSSGPIGNLMGNPTSSSGGSGGGSGSIVVGNLMSDAGAPLDAMVSEAGDASEAGTMDATFDGASPDASDDAEPLDAPEGG